MRANKRANKNKIGENKKTSKDKEEYK